MEPEHILLGLLADPQGEAQSILKRFAVDSTFISSDLKQLINQLPRVHVGNGGQVYLSQQTNKLLDNAEKEAEALKDEFISTKHLHLR